MFSPFKLKNLYVNGQSRKNKKTPDDVIRSEFGPQRQIYVKQLTLQKIKKVPKAFALDTDKSILSQFEMDTFVFIIMNDSNFVKRYFDV